MTERLLLASIHDVGPKFEREVDVLAARLERLLGGPRFAMLVVADHWGEAPLSASPAYARRLRDWADAGVEMFVHGWCHRDAAPAGFAARHMTAGEGEFAALDRAEALKRMTRARAVVEDATGRPAAGFIAPAWLYSDGTRAALADAGFALAEDHFRVWNPDNCAALTRGPVITWASRSRWRRLSSRFVAGAARTALGGQRVIRVAVHPGDTREPSILNSIDATIGRFARSHRPGRYAELAGHGNDLATSLATPPSLATPRSQ
ncbi:DUF2334 domain-containing protein [Polymorphobacter sp. PAMC 29334]|uniref:DUF2334 domain-containing protein n=1 Tax=Polymorphobacter sp. PAMC 29334 TaxID=2862331 RepID=UPI001C74D31B|nr:DUF2334 domain-containing protein [Polymorphobacter sp. PAMC 29334]QYE35812.1 DUF2334 domain-containing protein [Polymorphobacter sp. PAMC 29334]